MKTRPNIILIVLDTVRADHLSCYGYHRKTTPNLDHFSTEGVLFEQAITPAIWTLPSHVSIFTGLFPSKHGAHRAHQKLSTPYPTLAELLKGHGYQSAAFFHPDWLGEMTNATRGFGEIYGKAYWQDGLKNSNTAKKVNDKGSHQMIGKVREWTRSAKNKGPFFIFLNLFEAHNPYKAPDPFFDMYVPEGDRSRVSKINRNITDYYVGKAEMDKRDFQILGNLYDGEISYLDKNIGDLVQFFREENILDESVLIITSDHGENLGDHQHWGHRYCLYDSLIRVPLIIRYPGIFEGGKRPNQVVQSVDIFPTLMDVLGLDREDIRKELQGQVLFPESLEKRERDYSISEIVPKPDLRVYEGYPDFDASIFSYGMRAIRCKGYKLIWSTHDRHELYHLTWDPNELNNIYQAHNPKVGELNSLIEKWDVSNGMQEQPDYSIHGDSDVEQEIKTRLKDLGYVE